MTRFAAAAQCGGCGAKAAPPVLAAALAAVSHGDGDSSRILVGLSEPDDAAVHTVPDGHAVVTTADMFPPPVDNPADVGAICAANAVSDVYAMGGQVISALVLAAFPREAASDDITAALSSAAEVVRDCGGAIVGGHTVHSPAPLLGLSVIGSVDPRGIWRKRGARPGDALVISKPLGTGLAIAGGDDEARREAVAVMRQTNRAAAEALHRVGPHAVTDITGFGLLGHLLQMTSPEVGAEVSMSALPLLRCVREGRTGLSGAHQTNHEHVVSDVEADWDRAFSAVLIDPQTSGGLMAAVPRGRERELTGFTVIGRFIERSLRAIRIID